MKKSNFRAILALAAILFTSICAKATVITVSNNPVTAGMYTKIQDAADAAKAGDTLYIHPSGTTYGDISIKKQLTLIGGGYRRDEAPASNWISEISSISFDETLFETDGSKFIGLHITSNIGIPSTGTQALVEKILIERCFIGTVFMRGNNWVVKNSITGSVQVGQWSNIIISNNVIKSYVHSSDKPSVLVLNNFFIGGQTNNNYISSITNAIFANNIFLAQDPTFNASPYNSNFNIFNNNAFVISNTSTFNAIPGTNTGTGNIFHKLADIKLADANMILTSSVSSFSRGNNTPVNKDNWTFDLSSSSPGKNYGTDKTDVGIYGGAYPMPNLGGIPNIPFITELNILNSVLPATDDLEFNVKAKSIK